MLETKKPDLPEHGFDRFNGLETKPFFVCQLLIREIRQIRAQGFLVVGNDLSVELCLGTEMENEADLQGCNLR